jgi:hypothetical protein
MNFRMFNFLPNSDLSVEIGRNLCRDRVFAKTVCEKVVLMLGGFGSQQLNTVSSLSIEIPALLQHARTHTHSCARKNRYSVCVYKRNISYLM